MRNYYYRRYLAKVCGPGNVLVMKVVQPLGIVTNAPNLTPGTLTVAANSFDNSRISKFSWTNAMVAALSGTTGNLKVCTLPTKTVVLKTIIVITGQAAGLTVCTVSLGRTASAYIDYLVASNAKASTSTIYGQTFANLGANLSALVGDLPSLSTTTDVNIQFVSAVEDLSNITGSSGDVYLITQALP